MRGTIKRVKYIWKIFHKYSNSHEYTVLQTFISFPKIAKEVYAKMEEWNLPDVQQPQATLILVKIWKPTDVRQSVILPQALFSFQ